MNHTFTQDDIFNPEIPPRSIRRKSQRVPNPVWYAVMDRFIYGSDVFGMVAQDHPVLGDWVPYIKCVPTTNATKGVGQDKHAYYDHVAEWAALVLDEYATDNGDHYLFPNRRALESWLKGRIEETLSQKEDILEASTGPSKVTSAESFRWFSGACKQIGWSYPLAVSHLYREYFELEVGDLLPKRKTFSEKVLSDIMLVERTWSRFVFGGKIDSQATGEGWIEKIVSQVKTLPVSGRKDAGLIHDGERTRYTPFTTPRKRWFFGVDEVRTLPTHGLHYGNTIMTTLLDEPVRVMGLTAGEITIGFSPGSRKEFPERLSSRVYRLDGIPRITITPNEVVKVIRAEATSKQSSPTLDIAAKEDEVVYAFEF